jgi:hypothetical protein
MALFHVVGIGSTPHFLLANTGKAFTCQSEREKDEERAQ